MKLWTLADPRIEMRRRILGKAASGSTTEAVHLSIQGENSDERIELEPRMEEVVPSGPLRRWAHYNTEIFSSDLLTISNVTCPLPPLRRGSPDPTPTPSKTFTVDRKALWASLVSGSAPIAPKSPIYPWRRPHAFDFTRRFKLLPDGDFTVE